MSPVDFEFDIGDTICRKNGSDGERLLIIECRYNIDGIYYAVRSASDIMRCRDAGLVLVKESEAIGLSGNRLLARQACRVDSGSGKGEVI